MPKTFLRDKSILVMVIEDDASAITYDIIKSESSNLKHFLYMLERFSELPREKTKAKPKQDIDDKKGDGTEPPPPQFPNGLSE